MSGEVKDTDPETQDSTRGCPWVRESRVGAWAPVQTAQVDAGPLVRTQAMHETRFL